MNKRRNALLIIIATAILSNANSLLASESAAIVSCNANGFTLAQGGSPYALVNNDLNFDGACAGEITSRGQVNVPVQTDSGPTIYGFTQAATTSAYASSD